jgi:hypothetical protein
MRRRRDTMSKRAWIIAVIVAIHVSGVIAVD